MPCADGMLVGKSDMDHPQEAIPTHSFSPGYYVNSSFFFSNRIDPMEPSALALCRREAITAIPA